MSHQVIEPRRATGHDRERRGSGRASAERSPRRRRPPRGSWPWPAARPRTPGCPAPPRHSGARAAEILEANARDVAAAPGARPERGRHRSPDAQSEADRRDRPVASARSPPCPTRSARWSRSSRRPNGLEVSQVRVPLGVIFMIYESRPNVTVDAAALCVKSGNAVILRGGKEAIHSNRALHRVLADELAPCGPSRARRTACPHDRPRGRRHLLGLPEFIDLAIPRGGESLIRRVAAEAKMPVMKHYPGHLHGLCRCRGRSGDGDPDHPQRQGPAPGVCNAAETLLVHRDDRPDASSRAPPGLFGRPGSSCGATRRRGRSCPTMVRRADPTTGIPSSSTRSWRSGVVGSIDEAIEHIARHGSAHTETIVTGDLAAARKFVAEVDSSAVMVNASTRFNDGGQLGLGAEIGISTDKYHARGPCGLRELTSTKWVVFGDGQIRE